MTETLDDEVSEMCNISKGIREEGRAEGRVETVLEAIRNLMDSMKWTAEEAMAVLKVSEDEYSKYENMLKEAVSHA